MDSRIMEIRIQQWIPVIEEQAKSGMTKEEWCTLHGIGRTAFFRWQRRVREYLLNQCEAQPPQLPSSIPSNNEIGFVELASTQNSTAFAAEQRFEEAVQACGDPASISIRYGRFSIDLNGEIDAARLSTVLGVLKDAY